MLPSNLISYSYSANKQLVIYIVWWLDDYAQFGPLLHHHYLVDQLHGQEIDDFLESHSSSFCIILAWKRKGVSL